MVYRLREEIRSQKSGVRNQKEGTEDAIKTTLLSAGKAIVFVATAMGVGGVTLLFTGYYLHMEGFLVPLAMLTSSLATLIILPAVVALVRPGFMYSKQ